MVDRRNRGFSSSRARVSSREVDAASVGNQRFSSSHSGRAPRTSASRGQSSTRPSAARRSVRGAASADPMLSNARTGRPSSRGRVSASRTPRSPRDSRAQLFRHPSNQGFAADVQRKSNIKRIVLAVIALVAVVCAGFGAGSAAFLGSATAKMAPASPDALEAVLVEPEKGEPYYVLLAADLDASDESDTDTDTLLLVRIDEEAPSCTMVGIPGNLRAVLSDGSSHPLDYAKSLEGDSEIVSAIASSANVQIAHFARIDEAGLRAIAEKVGGVQVEVPEDVVDPATENVIIPAGLQTLDADMSMAFLRATDFHDGLETQSANQCAFATSVAQTVLDKGAFFRITLLDALSDSVETDCSAKEMLSVVSALEGMSASSILSGYMPGYELTRGGQTYFVCDTSEWDEIMVLMGEGKSPVLEEPIDVSTVDPASFQITVRNGAGIDGGASQITDILTEAGYVVAEKGNADSYVYDETLVVYKVSEYAAAAEAVLQTLGTGRTVVSNGFYAFDTEVLVVLGKDWAE